MFSQVSRTAFNAAFNAANGAMAGNKALSVAMPDDLPANRYFLTSDGMAGFTLSPSDDPATGYVCGVFRNPNATIKGAVHLAMEYIDAEAERLGLVALALDCFEAVAPIYAREGFETVESFDFDPAQAPDGWDASEMGEPAVYIMHKALRA